MRIDDTRHGCDLELGVAVVTTAPVLIVGSDTAGRGTVARRIHDGGPGAGHPWSACDAALLTPASLRAASDAASGGTLIDRVERLIPPCQDRLLHLLDDGSHASGWFRGAASRPRLLCGATPALWRLVSSGRFSERLLYRLNVVRMDVDESAPRSLDVLPSTQPVLPSIPASLAASHALPTSRPTEPPS